jgi:dolichyl-phosphate-mannose--protein O-mannosyl transferase
MTRMTAPPTVDDAQPASPSDQPPSAAVRETLERVRRQLVRPMPDDRLWGWLLPLAITLLAGLSRFWRITRPGGHSLKTPNAIVFDETYYVHDSWSLLHHGVETNGKLTAPSFVVHPPLGKWMMAVGEQLFDHGKTVTFHNTIYPASPLSFRFSAAVVGTLAVLMVCRIGRRMFRSTGLGCIAGLLVALDGLEFVQSRTAMLDIFLMFWVVAAFGCLVLDRDDGRRRLAARLTEPLGPGDWGPGLGFRPWRLAAGVCLGAACATKWNGAFSVPAFLLLAIFWDAGARRTAGVDRALGRAVVKDGLVALVPFLVVPAVVYTASWTGWFLSNGTYAYDHDKYIHPGQSWLAHDWSVLRGWLAYHREIWHYDDTLDAAHPYLSRPWGWLALERPVAYYYQTPAAAACGVKAPLTCSKEVLGVGNPALWWATIPAMIAVAWAWVSRRDWRAGAILVVFAFGYLPWIVEALHVVPVQAMAAFTPASDRHRTEFLFYMLPNVPFMALGVTMAVGMAMGRRKVSDLRRAVGVTSVAVYLAAVTAVFGYLYPVLAAQTITEAQWHSRMWFRHCDTRTHRDQHHENSPCWI